MAAHAAEYDEILIAYADCGTGGQLDTLLEKYGAKRLEGAHCYEFYAGSEVFERLAEQELGSFYLTDYLLKNFERLILDELGITANPQLFDIYFKHYKKLVYLAQQDDSALQAKAAKIALEFGWEYEYLQVGMQGLAPIASSELENLDVRIEVTSG